MMWILMGFKKMSMKKGPLLLRLRYSGIAAAFLRFC